MSQLTFKDIEIHEKQAKVKAVTAELDRLYKEATSAINRNHFAAICDKSYTYISEVLNSNNEASQKPYQPLMIAALIVEAPEAYSKIVDTYIHQLIGYKPPEKQSLLTPAEELEALKKKIVEHGLEKVFDL
jgi:hypothetical protein